MDIANWATNPRLQFTELAIHEARLCFIDTIACMTAGANQPPVRKAANAMQQAGATGNSQTVLYGISLSAPAAALVNGTAAHVLDYDDYEIPGSTHPSAAIIPALLANNDLSQSNYGQVMAGYLVGFETIVQIAQALGGYSHYMAGWHATSTIGSIGAAAASAYFLELPADKFAMALAISCSLSAGLKVQFGTETKSLHAGLAARAGVEAALLAQAGITANLDVLDGPYGFLACYNGSPSKHAEISLLSDTIESAMDHHGILRKPWPSCAYTHRVIEAALNHASTPDFNSENIVSGIIRIPEPYFRVCHFLDPRTREEAQFSALYCAASTLIDKALSPASFNNAALYRNETRSLMSLIELDAYDAGKNLDDMSPNFPDSLTLQFKDGTAQTETIVHVKGGIQNPLNETEIREKFQFCCQQSELLEQLLSITLDQPFQITL